MSLYTVHYLIPPGIDYIGAMKVINFYVSLSHPVDKIEKGYK